MVAIRVGKSLLALALTAVPAADALAADPGIPVVPRVDAATSGTGSVTIGAGTRIVVDSADASASTAGPTSPLLVGNTLLQAANSFASQLRWNTGLSLPVVTAASGDADDIFLTLQTSGTHGVEGYTLATTSGAGIKITAATSMGAFWGAQTLIQRIKVGGNTVAAGAIDDVPDVGYRAISVDVARNFWTVNELKDLIRRMGMLKLNVLQIHFNENEAFRLYTTNTSYSNLAPPSASYRYSQADINTIVNFAKAYEITVVPEIDTPYHSGAITRVNPSYSFSGSCNSQYFDTLDITSPSVRTWTVGLYQEFLSWFPGPYFHIGNDEVPLSLNSCSYVSGSGKSIEQWQIDFVNQLNTAVKAAGKTTVIWANGPDILPDTDVMFVNFGSNSNAAYLRGQGYKVVDTAYSSGSYQRFFIIPGMVRESRTATEAQIYGWTWPGGTNNAGQQLAIWMDFTNTAENYSVVDLYRARIATFAERTWAASAPTLTLAQFQTRWNAVGDAPGVATRPAATVNTTNPALFYNFNGTSALSSSEFTSPPQSYASSGSRSLPAVLGAGGSTATGTGKSGSGVRFSSGANNALTIGDERKPTAWTISMWVWPTASVSDTVLVGGWQSALKLSQYNTSSYVGVTAYGVGDYNFGYTAPLNAWTHLTFVSNGSQVDLYVNGSLQSTVTAAIPYPAAGVVGGPKPITGVIDDLKVFYGALSAAEVSNLDN